MKSKAGLELGQVLQRPNDSPSHQGIDTLSQSPLKSGRVSQGPLPPPQFSLVLTAGMEREHSLGLRLCHHPH